MIQIYHNPRCSKSRQALALLKAHGEDVEIIRYLDTPPDTDDIAILCKKLGIAPKKLIRHKEPRFAELQLSLDDQRSADEWCTILAENPMLLERPIVVQGDKACIGRPPEQVLDLL